MKKFLTLFLVLAISLGYYHSQAAPSITENRIERIKQFKRFHLVGSVTLSGGCVATYDLWVDVSIVPPRYNGISGTITMSGNCSGTQTINARANVNESMTSDTYETTEFHIVENVLSSTDQKLLEDDIQIQLNLDSFEIFGGR